MKAAFAWILGIFLLVSVSYAEEANGLRLTAQKTLLEKSKDRDAFHQWDKVDKALGLKVAGKNVSFSDLPEGTLEYTVIVKRWGHTPERFESYTGTEKFPALKRGDDANLTVGMVPMSGYEIGGNRKQFQDSIEGWRITVTHGDVETIKITSTSTFEKLLGKAKPGRKK